MSANSQASSHNHEEKITKDSNSRFYESREFDDTPKVISEKLYSWMYLPLPESSLLDGKHQFKLQCTHCLYSTNSESAFKSSNLASHWENHHFDTYKAKLDELHLNRGEVYREDSNESFDSTPTICQFVESENSISESDLRPIMRRKNIVAPTSFDPQYYISMIVRFLVEQNIPFTSVESIALQQGINHATLCKDKQLPRLSRYMMKKEILTLYTQEVEYLKTKLSQIKGRFAITIDKWKSNNNLDVFSVTLHFHTENFFLENYVIGFEVLNRDPCYKEKVLYKLLKVVLEDYDIKNRIISVTRDNDSTNDLVLKTFSQEMNNSFIGFGFNGDTRCVGQILNLVAGCILNYTFFKPKKTNLVKKKIEKVQKEHRGHARQVRRTPEIVFSIINGVREITFLKNTFSSLIEKSFEEEKTPDPKTLIRNEETRWLSTYRTLERFLFYREEILMLLEIVKGQSDSKQSSYNLKSLSISEFDWDYITIVFNILGLFESNVKILQGSNYQTAGLTIPHIAELLDNLETINTPHFKQNQPLLSLGLSDACSKILEYYPIRDSNIRPLKNLYIATMVDPRLKQECLKSLYFPSSIIAAVERSFYEVYEEYKKKNEISEMSNKRRKPNNQSEGFKNLKKNSFFSEEDTYLGQSEIEHYLTEKRPHFECDVGEYYRKRREVFPIIYEMARDFLCTPAMSAPAESLFPQVKSMVLDKRHNLLSGVIKMLAILKSRGRIAEPDIGSTYVEDIDKQYVNNMDQTLEQEEISEETGEMGAFDSLDIHTEKYYSDDNEELYEKLYQ